MSMEERTPIKWDPEYNFFARDTMGGVEADGSMTAEGATVKVGLVICNAVPRTS